MATTCPTCGRSDTVQSLADRFECLNDGTFINADGTEAEGGLAWTSRVPEGAALNAEITTAAYEAQN